MSRARRKMFFVPVFLGLLLGALCASAQFEDPFGVVVDMSNAPAEPLLSVTLSVPEEHLLYAEQTRVEAKGGARLDPLSLPPPKRKQDPFSDEVVGVHERDVVFVYRVSGLQETNLTITVSYQGCDATRCFFPQTQVFELPIDRSLLRQAPEEHVPEPQEELEVEREASAEWRSIADRFQITGVASGYLPPEKFLQFLEGEQLAEGQASRTDIGRIFNEQGLIVSLFLILLGGLALNLTPCVLPMIPVNLAIIGAGVQGGNRARGFLLGSAYGLGIALVYGALGLLVAFTGARFGAINSSPWFNVSVALLFFVLALAMFGVFNLDLTRFQNKLGPTPSHSGSLFAAFGMGAVAALLAGACVAPVVISVLLLAVDLYQGGSRAALLLPFLLGLGMALPWPFAGAGMSFLPKPGKWMERIKYAFGVVILAVAIYYAMQGVRLFTQRVPDTDSLAEALTNAEAEGKPVFLDFWATWCKNCIKMEKTTFLDPDVEQALQRFAVVKYQAEDLKDPAVKAVLDYYNVQGLPTYLILSQGNSDEL